MTRMATEKLTPRTHKTRSTAWTQQCTTVMGPIDTSHGDRETEKQEEINYEKGIHDSKGVEERKGLGRKRAGEGTDVTK